MKISSSFNKFYWGAIINDIHSNLKVLKWNNIEFKLNRLDSQGLHELLKIITYHNKSLKEMDSKEVTEYLEDIRVLLGENSFTLEVDNEEWMRILKNLEEETNV